MELIFWISVSVIFYAYLGYPLWLVLLRKTRPLPLVKVVNEPAISVVIAVCNEERNIVRRVRDVLAQEYPAEKLEVIVASDGSTDGTIEVLGHLQSPALKIIDLPLNQGKAIALNEGIAQAQGELIVFTDARQTFAPGVLRHLAANFADPRVGCVSGELIFLQDSASTIQAEMGAYWKYEKWIRKAESATGSVVGATGAIYAIRRELYRPLPQGTLLDDVLTPMHSVMQGYRTIFDGVAIAYDVVSQDLSQEWKRKVRTLAGNWQLLSLEPGLLLPWCNPCWWRFIAHKILRLIVPFALLLLLVSGAQLDGGLYKAATLLQLSFYGVALTGAVMPAARLNRLVNLCYFFLVMNVAAVAGFWRWITGQCATSWKPTYVKGADQ